MSVVDERAFRQFRGDGKLATWSVAAVAATRIPPAAKVFLLNVGFPFDAGAFRFHHGAEALPAVDVRPSCRTFGFVGFRPLCIDEDGGQVLLVVTEEPGRSYFGNSDLLRFAACLRVYGRYLNRDEDLPDEQAEELEREWSEIDPRVFRAGDSLWSEVLDDMLTGGA